MSSLDLFPDSLIDAILIHTATLRKRTLTIPNDKWGDGVPSFIEYEIPCFFEPWRRGEDILFELKGVGERGDARAWFKKIYETEDGDIVVAHEDEIVWEGNYYAIKQLYPYKDGGDGRMYEARLEKIPL